MDVSAARFQSKQNCIGIVLRAHGTKLRQASLVNRQTPYCQDNHSASLFQNYISYSIQDNASVFAMIIKDF